MPNLLGMRQMPVPMPRIRTDTGNTGGGEEGGGRTGTHTSSFQRSPRDSGHEVIALFDLQDYAVESSTTLRVKGAFILPKDRWIWNADPGTSRSVPSCSSWEFWEFHGLGACVIKSEVIDLFWREGVWYKY